MFFFFFFVVFLWVFFLFFGIPREKHDLRSMQDLVPARLDAMPFDACDPDVLAEILVYLISRNIVRLPCNAARLCRWNGARISATFIMIRTNCWSCWRPICRTAWKSMNIACGSSPAP